MSQTADANGDTAENQKQFYADLIKGLTSVPKSIDWKYCYDAVGDKLFQQIRTSDEYYLERCETEIFLQYTAELCKLIISDGTPFDLIELGATNAEKAVRLLAYLYGRKVNFTYIPIDISANTVKSLEIELKSLLPSMDFRSFNGDYIDMLKQLNSSRPKRRRVILFLNSNIGNLKDDEAFCHDLRNFLSPKDLLIIGFDVKKYPKLILDSYNDKAGLIKKFVINLLHRINREFSGNIRTRNFDYYSTYDPQTNSLKAYLISLANQHVRIKDHNEVIAFEENEEIYVGLARVYTIERIYSLASSTRYRLIKNFFDPKKWFVDSVWAVE